MTNQTMTFDLARLERFRQALIEAHAAEQDSFEFDGHPFLVKYADYLIEYLDDNIRRIVRETVEGAGNA